MKLHALACALLGCGLVAATACAPNPAKVCENVVSIMEDEGWEMTQEDCMENIDEGRDECEGDYNAAMRCMQSASSAEDMGACAAICEGGEEEEESE